MTLPCSRRAFEPAYRSQVTTQHTSENSEVYILFFADTAPSWLPTEVKPLFGSKEEKHDESNPEDYDPHYDPIVALPELVDVKTGEEDEEKGRNRPHLIVIGWLVGQDALCSLFSCQYLSI